MTLLPRTGSYLIDSMLAVLRVILFTLAVCLVVLVSALVLRATIVLTEPLTGSRRAASLVALVAFATYLGVPAYLLAVRTDDEDL